MLEQNSKKFYPPMLDYVFKRIFGDQRNTDILAAFLRAALNLSEEEVDQITIIDPNLKREFNDDKLSILDVKICLKSGERIGVEVQIYVSQELRNRVVFSGAKLLAEQLKRGERYGQVERVACIVICGETLLFEEPGYYNCYSLRNVRTGREFTDILTVNVLEPGKLPAQPDGSLLFHWGQFFNVKSREELSMVKDTDPMINKAAGLVMELNEDEAERMRADSRLYFLMDQQGLLREREARGRAEGWEEAKKETARNLLALGVSPATVAKATGLDMETVKGFSPS
jgi:predicted transposase/invertase (TIGR01784 family)